MSSEEGNEKVLPTEQDVARVIRKIDEEVTESKTPLKKRKGMSVLTTGKNPTQALCRFKPLSSERNSGLCIDSKYVLMHILELEDVSISAIVIGNEKFEVQGKNKFAEFEGFSS